MIMRKILLFLLLLCIVCQTVDAQKPLKKPQRKPKPQMTQPAKTTPSKKPNKHNNASTPRIVASGSIDGHDYVDLGLSVKWATCNVGASSPSDYGSYFAWGETSSKSEYTEENSLTYRKSMGDIAGNPRYDAARANWGSSWRLPTKMEIEDLVDKCKTRWTTYNGRKGRLVTGHNGKSIFLPAAGWRYGSSLSRGGECGACWSSTPYDGNTEGAYILGFDSGSFIRGYNYRNDGRTVRPVSE